jgi:hypothetical protein
MKKMLKTLWNHHRSPFQGGTVSISELVSSISGPLAPWEYFIATMVTFLDEGFRIPVSVIRPAYPQIIWLPRGSKTGCKQT